MLEGCKCTSLNHHLVHVLNDCSKGGECKKKKGEQSTVDRLFFECGHTFHVNCLSGADASSSARDLRSSSCSVCTEAGRSNGKVKVTQEEVGLIGEALKSVRTKAELDIALEMLGKKGNVSLDVLDYLRRSTEKFAEEELDNSQISFEVCRYLLVAALVAALGVAWSFVDV